MNARTNWYKEAVVYQIYPLSFKDSNNDGIGDIPGIISKLDYVKELGATAIWFSPLYPSPWKDYGYDVSDYRAIHPAFGSMEDFDRLLDECHKRGLKVMMDMVLNHTSTEHEWFKKAMADPSSPYRDYYIIRPGRKKERQTSASYQLDIVIYRNCVGAHRGHGRFLSSSVRTRAGGPQLGESEGQRRDNGDTQVLAGQRSRRIQI